MFDVVAENSGGTAGTYDVALRHDDATLDRRTGRLEPGAAATVTLAGSLDEPGDCLLRTGDAEIPVTVRAAGDGPSIPALGAALLAIVVVAAAFLVRRRR